MHMATIVMEGKNSAGKFGSNMNFSSGGNDFELLPLWLKRLNKLHLTVPHLCYMSLLSTCGI